ncbi:MAG: hypothetical protein AB8B96_13920 [Lysobacterales bacterium]
MEPSPENPLSPTTDVSDRIRISDQIQRNAVALISLFIALCSLGYNTWRNETTETQRNVRQASFELIEHLEQFQSVVNAMVYPTPRRVELWVDGWGEVKACQTLSTLLPAPIPDTLDTLVAEWSQSVDVLRGDNRSSAQTADIQLTASVDRARNAVLDVIQALD